MAIVDAAYYLTVYMGKEASECDFPALEARAEDVIGAMTRWQATADTIASLTPFQRTLVKKAICAQVDFFAVNGLESVAGDDGRGFTVGKFSVSGKSESDVVHKGAMSGNLSPLCVMYLEQSGLLNPAVPVVEGML
jgi:hypothetical protein